MQPTLQQFYTCKCIDHIPTTYYQPCYQPHTTDHVANYMPITYWPIYWQHTVQTTYRPHTTNHVTNHMPTIYHWSCSQLHADHILTYLLTTYCTNHIPTMLTITYWPHTLLLTMNFVLNIYLSKGTLDARGFLREEPWSGDKRTAKWRERREKSWEDLWFPTTVTWSYCANRFELGSRSDPASSPDWRNLTAYSEWLLLTDRCVVILVAC